MWKNVIKAPELMYSEAEDESCQFVNLYPIEWSDFSGVEFPEDGKLVTVYVYGVN